MTLDFFQIYYSDEQLTELYPFAHPVKTEGYNPYFENAVIADVVPKSEADLISVCSWRLRRKRNDTKMQLRGAIQLTEERILGEDYDVAVLTPRSHKDIRQKMILWHGKDAMVTALNEFDKFFRIPDEVRNTIYENHFIATKKIYHAYVTDCLLPAIDFIAGRECFFADAGYTKRKKASDLQRFRDLSGRQDWPIVPFVLERLFCSWINDMDLKVIRL